LLHCFKCILRGHSRQLFVQIIAFHNSTSPAPF
jgi:hypothetical protein